jgi:hypothetical protein
VDFEASSLGKRGFPIEVGWVAENGSEEGYLIRPAPGWDEWDAQAEQIHGISRDRLLREGTPHDAVAGRMLDVLSGHDLFASAPSWDGQWLSKLLRAARLPRHALRLRDTEEAHRAVASAVLERTLMTAKARAERIDLLVQAARETKSRQGIPAHRAVDDARQELQLWLSVRRQAEAAGAAA